VGLELLVMGAFGSFFSETVAPLFVLPLVGVNILFFFYWLLRLKGPFIIFLATLFLAYPEYELLYQFPNNAIQTEKGLKILTYNVRLFNKYKWIKKDDVPKQIMAFIAEQDPDIICFQEFSKELSPAFSAYPYRFFKASQKGGNHGTSILSKVPIQKTGVIPFESITNNGIFADVQWNKNALRIYNIHFESFGLQPNDSLFSKGNPLKFSNQLHKTLKKQSAQVEQFNQLQKAHNTPYVICTDLNNNAFSKSYALMKAQRKDAFEEAGNGLGTTYWFSFFPLRIDYVFTAPSVRVLSFETFSKIDLSDHKPVMATVK